MLKLTSNSKSLLGGRQRFNTDIKYKRLYKAYESLALCEDNHNEDNQI